MAIKITGTTVINDSRNIENITSINGTAWATVVSNALEGSEVDLNELTDVTIGTLATGQVVQYNGSGWVNTGLDFTDIASTIADAQVPASAVTQHEAALTIPYANLTGNPTTIAGYGITDASTTAEVNSAISTAVGNLIDSAPTALDTLNELAASLGDDADFAGSMTTNLAGKLNLSGGALTGAVTTTSTFDGRDVSADGTKLDTVETNADVTDTANVTAAGALMDSEVTNLAQVKAFNSSDYATSAQGTKADSALQSHPSVSAASSANNSGRTYIQDISLDSFGHVTGLASATETVTNTDTTYSAGGGLGLSGTTFSHSDTSSQASVNNSGRTYIQDISLDGYGHVTSLSSATETVTNTDTNTTYSTATSSTLGLVKIGYSENGKNYPVELSSGKMYVNVPWSDTNTDTNTTYSAGTGMSLSGTTFNCNINSPGEVGLGNLSSSGNNLSGSFTATGNITAYSDARLKSNVETIDNALDKVSAMRGVMFDKDGQRETGVIAQEVQAVIPEAVLEGEEYLSVAYGNLVGVLIEAIKELKAEVEELKAAK